MQIRFVDAKSRAAAYEYVPRRNGCIASGVIFQMAGFGVRPIKEAMVNEIKITGDLWRFLERIGISELYAVMKDPSLGSRFLAEFRDAFSGAGNDDIALSLWEEKKAQAMALSVPAPQVGQRGCWVAEDLPNQQASAFK